MPSENDSEDVFDEIQSEEEISGESQQKEREIHFKTPSRKIKDLYFDYKQGDLDPRPPFQRGYVWDVKKASRLVESVLMNVPIPVVYTAELSNGKEIVIDGQQRLMSLFGFMDGLFPKGNALFKLHGLEVMPELNDTTYKKWDKELQRSFSNYPVPLITISKDSDENVRFEIFERLNTGSVKLNDQELRNCIYRGPYNDFCREMAEKKAFQTVLNSPVLKERMLDVELVLRFFAFYNTTYLKYKSPMKRFLNDEMKKHQNISLKEKDKFEEIFDKSTYLVKTVFGEKAFKRLVLGHKTNRDSAWEQRKVNRGLFDILMFGFTLYEKYQIVPNSDAVREELLWLSTSNDDFIDALSGSGTDKPEKIRLKFDTWLSSLSKIVGYKPKEPRSFSFSLKQKLWKLNPMCAYEKCGQKILDCDDAEVDHIKHYWRGGKTIPKNARLVHRYCNRARGGHD